MAKGRRLLESPQPHTPGSLNPTQLVECAVLETSLQVQWLSVFPGSEFSAPKWRLLGGTTESKILHTTLHATKASSALISRGLRVFFVSSLSCLEDLGQGLGFRGLRV